MPIEPLTTTGGRKLIPDPSKPGSFIADPTQNVLNPISPSGIPNVGIPDVSLNTPSSLMTTGGRRLVPSTTRPGAFMADPNQVIQQPTTQPTQVQTSVQEPALNQANIPLRQNAIRDYIDTYRQLHQELGISGIKDQFDQIQKQYTDLQNELQDKIAQVNENPWLSEGSRQKRVESLQNKYLARTNVLSNKLSLYGSLYNQGLREVEAIAGDVSSQLRLGEQEQIKLQQLAQQRALAEEKLNLQNILSTERLGFQKQSAEERLAQQRQLQEERLASAQTSQADIKEYQLAQSQGFKGNFMDFLRAKKQALTINVGGSGLSPAAQDLLAQIFLATGQLPALGIGATGLRQSIFNRAADYAQKLGLSGVDVVTGQVGFQANKTALSQLTKQKNIILAFEKTANQNLDIARQLSDKVDRTGSPVLNRWLLAGRRTLAGDVDVARFDAAVRTSINEYARVVSTVTGGGVTSDTARREVESLLNTAQTKAQVLGVIQTLRQEMENRRLGYEEQEAEIERSIRSSSVGGRQQITSPSDVQQGTTKGGRKYRIIQ